MPHDILEMNQPIFYSESGGIRHLQNTKPVFYKLLNNGKKVIMTIEDIRNPMIQPYNRFDYEMIIKEVKPNEFVYSRTMNTMNLNENNLNNAKYIETNKNLNKELTSTRPSSPVSEGDPTSPMSIRSVSSTPKAFGRLPSFIGNRTRRGRKGRRARKTLKKRRV
jgi:hypothetical protein